MRPLEPLAAARVKTVESKAGISGRLGETGILWIVPGRSTIPWGKGMMGRVAECDGAMMINYLDQTRMCQREILMIFEEFV